MRNEDPCAECVPAMDHGQYGGENPCTACPSRQVLCSCGHYEVAAAVEVGLCGDCADVAVDAAQNRLIARVEGW